jgi:hypothetical protein
MSPNLRRGLAAAVAVITMVVLAFWTARGGDWVRDFAFRHHLVGLAVGTHADPQAGTGPTLGEIEGATVFYTTLLGALVLAGGCAAALLILRTATGFNKRMVIYLALLAAILPASLYNYGHAEGDFALRAKYQVILNLVLMFVGATVCLTFRRWKVEAPDARVLKVMVFVLVLFSAVLTPGFLTFIWFLWRVNILTFPETRSVSRELIGTVAGVVSVVIAYLQYRLDAGKSHTEASATSP